MKYIIIGICGFVGAVLRFYIENINLYNVLDIPINTLLINVTGSFVLGLFFTLAIRLWNINDSIRLGIATGLLGAYTTFSTMCKEIFNLIVADRYLSAVIYLLSSIVLGLLSVYLGVKSAYITINSRKVIK